MVFRLNCTNLFPLFRLLCFLDLFKFVLDTGSLPPSWHESKIAAIPKPGRDPLHPSSYRPISLLNQDYKLFSAILVNRLNQFISDYIYPDQTGFIPSRNITDNIRKTLNIFSTKSITFCFFSNHWMLKKPLTRWNHSTCYPC